MRLCQEWGKRLVLDTKFHQLNIMYKLLRTLSSEYRILADNPEVGLLLEVDWVYSGD